MPPTISMSQSITIPQRMDFRWACGQVAKGVKPVAISDSDVWLPETDMLGFIEQVKEMLEEGTCYLDTIRDPGLVGKEFTGGTLLRPIIGYVQGITVTDSRGVRVSYSLFFAANQAMADLFKWAYSLIKSGDDEETRRAHTIVGLLCGYSPLAIEGFLEQPDEAG